MIGLLWFVVAVLASPFKSKIRLEAENAALRHQLVVDHGMTHSLYVHNPNGYGVELLYDVTRQQSKISDLLAPAARFGREIHDRQPQTVRITFPIEGV
jgi:hypothetical protein